MLIFALRFSCRNKAKATRAATLSSKCFATLAKPRRDYSRYNSTAESRRFGKRALERCLVPTIVSRN